MGCFKSMVVRSCPCGRSNSVLHKLRRRVMLVRIGDRARLPRTRRQQRNIPPRAALHFKMVPRLVRHIERHRLPRNRIAIPVRKLKIVEAPHQRRTVVHARPRRLANAVGSLPPPALQIVRIVNLDLAHGRRGRWQRRRNIVRPVPSIPQPPLVLRLLRCKRSRDRRNILRRFILRQRADIVVRQHAVVDAQLVDIAAAIVVVRALHAGRRDDARVRTELVERRVEHARRRLRSRQACRSRRSECRSFHPTPARGGPTHLPFGKFGIVYDTRVRPRFTSVTNASKP